MRHPPVTPLSSRDLSAIFLSVTSLWGLPGAATGSHIRVDRGTPVPPLGQPQLNVPRTKSQKNNEEPTAWEAPAAPAAPEAPAAQRLQTRAGHHCQKKKFVLGEQIFCRQPAPVPDHLRGRRHKIMNRVRTRYITRSNITGSNEEQPSEEQVQGLRGRLHLRAHQSEGPIQGLRGRLHLRAQPSEEQVQATEANPCSPPPPPTSLSPHASVIVGAQE